MKPGDKINLKNGYTATVTSVGLSDFIGDPYPIYIQWTKNNKVKTGYVMSNELKQTK